MVSQCVLKCPVSHTSLTINGRKQSWPRGGMVDTKDLKAVSTLLHIRNNI